MPEKYGSHETAALIVLTLANREVPNVELTNDYKIKLGKHAREELNDKGLLASRTEGRRLVHRITENGITWCEQQLADIEPPKNAGPLVRVVFEMVRRSNLRFADLMPPTDLESLIRAAYRDLSAKPQDWVRLAKLRPRLDGADRDEVDKVLLAMIRTGLVHLAPDSNRKALTDADHDAAIRIGGQDKHLLAIEES
jgi:hypothetical protein